MRQKGFFIVLDGMDGSGKTTQARMLCRALRRRAMRVILTREPGGTLLAETIRKILLHPKNRLTPLAELFLYEAARAQHVRETILPALRRGVTVVSERFTDSTLAYQGYGRGLNLKTIQSLNRIASEGASPDATIVLDLPVQQGFLRIGRRSRQRRQRKDRLELESALFHRKVREGFHALTRRGRPGMFLISAASGAQEVHARIMQVVATVCNYSGRHRGAKAQRHKEK